ncbi:MAG TPA: hypothetical protein VLG69_02930 [Candidatus Andersenbacteria bacterium]|nr:hypothetical protein [Candidatus Andersenbacteria bacterium]
MDLEDKRYFEDLLNKYTASFDEKLEKQLIDFKEENKHLLAEASKESQRHLEVALEHFEGQVSAVAEQHISLEQKQDIANEKLDEVLDILKANQETLIEHDKAIKELQQTHQR